MVTIPTVLILGAGASIPYGFPSGRELVNSVLSIASPYNKDNPDHKILMNAGDFDEDDLKIFYLTLSRSGQTSVDVFLEHRPEFMKIGKLAIALSLIPFENEKNLYSYPFDPSKRAWYDIILRAIDGPINIFKNNRLSIVTFNYDRSIDYYLYTSVLNTYKLSDQECQFLLAAIPIIHVHGNLGNLPWQGQSFRHYNSKLDDPGIIVRAANNIIIITEGIDTSEEFREARKLLSSANRIFFLGFGYNDTNLERLRINDMKNTAKIGTTFGLGEAEIKSLMKKWPGIRFAPNSYDIIDFFKKEIDLE